MGAILCVCVCVPWPEYETFRTAQGPISSTQLKGQTSMLMVPEKFPISHVSMVTTLVMSSRPLDLAVHL